MFGTEHPEQHRGQLVFAICLIGLMGTFYTVKGGIRAVVWTDAIQLVLVIGAACLTVGLLLHRIGRPPAELLRILSDPAAGGGAHGKLTLFDTSARFHQDLHRLGGAARLHVPQRGELRRGP